MKTKNLTLTALFSVILFLSSFFKLPLGPVPVTTQTFFVLVIGLILTPKYAFLSTSISLILQCIFSLAYASPTFGFVIGFVIAATVVSIITHKRKDTSIALISVVIGTIIIYICGTTYFQMMLPNKSLHDVLSLTMLPFLIGDTIKAILAITTAKILQKMLK